MNGSQFSGWNGGNWGPGGGDVPGGQYRIVRAEYGVARRQVDVTRRLRDLARTDRSFQAGNEAFGVDPAPGLAKTLRIDARDSRGNTRTFEYREGGVVDGSQFSDWNGGGWNRGANGPGPENDGQLSIISAVYGAQPQHRRRPTLEVTGP